jgi:small-conductance mechanosensitive channel
MRGAGMIRIASLALALVLAAALCCPAAAQSNAPSKSPAESPPPPQVQELMRLLDDPAVRDWIAARRAATPGATSEAAADSVPGMTMNPGHFLDQRVARIRAHLLALGWAFPALPGDLAEARARLMAELDGRGTPRIVLLVVAFLALGWLFEWLAHYRSRGIQRWIDGLALETVADRLRAAAARFALAVAMVFAFALGSIGTFLLFEWPPSLREIVLGYLLAILILRTALACSHLVLAPDAERFRLAPLDTAAARHWHRYFGAAVGWLAIGWMTVAALRRLQLPQPDRNLVAYILGLVLLAIGIAAVWRRPGHARGTADAARPPGRATSWLWTGLFVVLWLLWIAAMMPGFWFLVAVTGIPLAIHGMRRSIRYVLRPAGSPSADERRGVIEVCLDRGLRALLIIGGALLLAKAWHVDLVAMTMQDTLGTRLVRGLLKAVVIALAAEFLWHLLRAAIDMRLARADLTSTASEDQSRRLSRLRTLLPILRNILLIAISVIAGLMILSSMGIEIGPLIAGAGVVGVAIGFGAQTLVKDVISGMFYLLDDAFRVGEYIQSGAYKGTVESFSLRSVKLRHQRGPIFTVPFGELGAVQNMSRDWVIDKLMIGVSYNANLDKARKLIKEIGKELAADPEFAPYILEPLKMQGVEQFGDYAIQIRMKMMTKPGHQFTIRRRALAAINKAFKENGIEFARPTVSVAGNAADTAAVAGAHQLTHPPLRTGEG